MLKHNSSLCIESSETSLNGYSCFEDCPLKQTGE